MSLSLRDMLRFLQGGSKKERSVFKSEKEAYDLCRKLYKTSGGVTPELLRSYEFYMKNMNEDCGRFFGPSTDNDRPNTEQGMHKRLHVRRA